MRRKQYEHYRNQLLDFEGVEGVEWKTLGENVQVLRGRRLTKSDLLQEGKYQVFHGGLEPLGYYNLNNREADSVMIINVGASAGTVGYCNKDFWSSDGCFTLSKNPLLLPKYLYCYLKQQERKISSKVRKAGIPTLDAKVIEDINIPLIPLSKQTEIVSKLDTFENLIQSLEQEIKLRKQQYEYYREKLLTFE
jgi:type I restriction enzyme S subunit